MIQATCLTVRYGGACSAFRAVPCLLQAQRGVAGELSYARVKQEGEEDVLGVSDPHGNNAGASGEHGHLYGTVGEQQQQQQEGRGEEEEDAVGTAGLEGVFDRVA